MSVMTRFVHPVVVTVLVMLLVAVVMAVTESSAGAVVPTVACGDAPGLCPSPPGPDGPWVVGDGGDW